MSSRASLKQKKQTCFQLKFEILPVTQRLIWRERACARCVRGLGPPPTPTERAPRSFACTGSQPVSCSPKGSLCGLSRQD